MKISIDEKLLIALEEHRKETPFKDISELIHFILQDYLLAQENDTVMDDGKKELDDRLRDLGYM
ncbi:MAG TPA: hypothetical protein ENJ10_04635 [Caldithrix abyssi]|uniref:Uncharacterized protein n=1 Tax=Caldithrix abyssi TaxID=187145 RepID=A0A7V1LL07_CALAY|nr:hypothetical protein [Caldithrix abyssi]